MKNLLQKLIVSGILLFFANAAIGSDNDIKIGENEQYGKYLTDSRGMTLYWYLKDAVGKSRCTESCLERWPVYHREKIVALDGLVAKDFGEIKRDDGSRQTTFRGYPLYYCINDLEPGGINRQNGNNILGLIVDPDNFPPTQKGNKK